MKESKEQLDLLPHSLFILHPSSFILSFPTPAFQTANGKKQAKQSNRRIKNNVPGIENASREITLKVQWYADEVDQPMQQTVGIEFLQPEFRHDEDEAQHQ